MIYQIHINPVRSQPYPNPKYISFNNRFRGDSINSLGIDSRNDNSGTFKRPAWHYSDVITIAMTSQITTVSIVYSTVCSGTDQRKHQSSASLAFVRGIHRWLVNSPHKGPVKRKMFPFDDVIMDLASFALCHICDNHLFPLHQPLMDQWICIFFICWHRDMEKVLY